MKAKKQEVTESKLDMTQANVRGTKAYYAAIRKEQKELGTYTAENKLDDEAELKMMESKLGMTYGGSEPYDPHSHKDYLDTKLYRAGNGAVVDVADPKEAEELVRMGVLTLI